MPSIELRNINNYICRNISLAVKASEMLVLLGPVGSGKSTILNVIAGLAEYDGSVLFDGLSTDALPPHERKVGYVFQDLLLFPHLTVDENINYGLKVRGCPPAQGKNKRQEMLSLLGLESLAHRYPKNLSGGEKQRVALARALAISPDILLLDEPLSSLDLKTTNYLRMEIRRIQKELQITTIYVTHNQAEAEEMADRIAIVHQGALQQVDCPEEIFFNPKSEAVSDYIGKPNILVCTRSRTLGGGLVAVECGGVSIVVPHHGNEVKKIAISPRDVYISTDEPPGPDLNRFRTIITEILPSEASVGLELKLGENILRSELPHDIFKSLGLKVGRKVFLMLKMRWIRVC